MIIPLAEPCLFRQAASIWVASGGADWRRPPARHILRRVFIRPGCGRFATILRENPARLVHVVIMRPSFMKPAAANDYKSARLRGAAWGTTGEPLGQGCPQTEGASPGRPEGTAGLVPASSKLAPAHCIHSHLSPRHQPENERRRLNVGPMLSRCLSLACSTFHPVPLPWERLLIWLRPLNEDKLAVVGQKWNLGRTDLNDQCFYCHGSIGEQTFARIAQIW